MGSIVLERAGLMDEPDPGQGIARLPIRSFNYLFALSTVRPPLPLPKRA